MKVLKLAGYNNIYYVEPFFDEYEQLFGNNAKEYDKYLEKLRYHLGVLDGMGRKAITLKNFEKVENTEFFSIRNPSKLNTRTIYAFVTDDDKILLLHSFKEKSKSDYDIARNLAGERMKNLEE